MKLVRSSFLGGAIAATALSACSAEPPVAAGSEAALAAIVPVVLAGSLAADPLARRRQVEAAIAGFDAAVAGLPPLVQAEIGRLFGLLRNPLTRAIATGIAAPLASASPMEVERFLNSWRFSSIEPLRAGYDALHQLIFAAWYGNPIAWPAIGYPGPPALEP
jgi:hypothetical protein